MFFFFSPSPLFICFQDIQNLSDSDDEAYIVEDFVRPDKIRRSVNDDSADILGNFDDEKRKAIVDNSYYEESMDTEEDEDEEEEEEKENGDQNLDASTDKQHEEHLKPVKKNELSETQLQQLLRGTAKPNRYVLYVTNLNFETTKKDLMEHFGVKGEVRSIRIPKKRRGGFAFVEMSSLEGYRRGFELHNSTLDGRQIKVQFSEGGKKKSANKKNILKQKNRKLAEMRKEFKAFTKPGKFYDKEYKREKTAERLRLRRQMAATTVS